jgi:hypothetical protein
MVVYLRSHLTNGCMKVVGVVTLDMVVYHYVDLLNAWSQQASVSGLEEDLADAVADVFHGAQYARGRSVGDVFPYHGLTPCILMCFVLCGILLLCLNDCCTAVYVSEHFRQEPTKYSTGRCITLYPLSCYEHHKGSARQGQ